MNEDKEKKEKKAKEDIWYNKFKEWMNTKKITPAQFLTAMMAVFLFVAFETSTFHAWDDFGKATFYIGLVVCSTLLGFKAVDIRKFAFAVGEIWLDPSLNRWQKIQKIFDLILPWLIEAGKEFHALNEEQFPEKPEVKAKDLTYETTEGYVDTEHTSSTG